MAQLMVAYRYFQNLETLWARLLVAVSVEESWLAVLAD